MSPVKKKKKQKQFKPCLVSLFLWNVQVLKILYFLGYIAVKINSSKYPIAH